MVSSDSAVPSGDCKGSRGIAALLRSQMRNIAPFLTLILLSAFFAIASPSFATIDNVGNILTQVSVTGIIAVGLTFPPRVLVLCEPTRGMDVGAKNDVIHIIRHLREQGLAIVVLSTEPETVLSLADRIIVLKRGTVVREFANEKISKDRLLEAA